MIDFFLRLLGLRGSNSDIEFKCPVCKEVTKLDNVIEKTFIAGCECSAEYRVTVSPDRKTVKTEILDFVSFVNGKMAWNSKIKSWVLISWDLPEVQHD